jgi:hypothetical protein
VPSLSEPIRSSLANDQDLALRPRRHRERAPPRRGAEHRERTGPRDRLLAGAMSARREEAAAMGVESAAAAPRRLEPLPWRLGQVLERPDGRQRRERLRLAVEELGQAPLEGELRHEGGHIEARVRAGGVVVELRRGAHRVPRRGRRADVLQLLVADGGLGQRRLRPTVEQEVRLHPVSEPPPNRSMRRKGERETRNRLVGIESRNATMWLCGQGRAVYKRGEVDREDGRSESADKNASASGGWGVRVGERIRPPGPWFQLVQLRNLRAPELAVFPAGESMATRF